MRLPWGGGGLERTRKDEASPSALVWQEARMFRARAKIVIHCIQYSFVALWSANIAGCDGGVDGVEAGATAWGTAESPMLPLLLGGTPGPSNIAFEGFDAGDYAGFSLAEVGDFNGDGHTDYVIGAIGEHTAHLVLGGAWLANAASPIDLSPQSNPNIVGVFGDGTGDQLGRSVSPAGDVNGDGLADVVVGAYLGDAAGTNAGSAYVVFGHPNPGADLLGPRGVA